MPPDDVLRAGVRLGDRYHLQQRLGAGGMGEVWLAVDEVLKRGVAVKAMLPGVADDPDFAKRFAAEATAMARINHPAVASIHDFGRSGGVAFLVMEYVDGESLAQRLARGGRLAPEQTMRLIAQVADGLQAVHDQGLVHRDIKPANLLVRRDGSVVITDFGIARHEDASRLTASGAILGTPTYLSPEQVRGEPATPRSDVYSLGLVAYECLAGEKPFVGDNPYAVALQRLQAGPRTIGITLPVAVLAVVEGALATDPARRWESAAALAVGARAAIDPASGALPGVQPGSLPGAQPGSALGAQQPSFSPGAQPGSVPGAQPGSALGTQPSFSPGAQPGSVPGALRGALSGAQSGAPRATSFHSRRVKILAAVAALILAGAGAAAWTTSRDRAGESGGRGSAEAAVRPDQPDGSAGPGATEAASPGLPAGFVACGPGYCPAEPMCWAGLLLEAGEPKSPRPVDCATPHYWETFQAIPLPPGKILVGDEPLIARPDLAGACSAAALKERSRKPAKTRTWQREAWPISFGGGTLMHCIVSSPQGESTGTVVR